MSSEESGLVVEGLDVRFGSHAAVDGVDLELERRQVLAILGPSGCGKSTLLRGVAGLIPQARGSVSWAGEDLSSVPPHRRGFGLMFQEHALFPHRGVAENIEFGLRMQRRPSDDRRRRVSEVVELLGLVGLEDRAVTTLSGGEAQRVALGRALAPSPRLLMLDEPLASLDRSLSERLLRELRAILGEIGMTAIYVTHDQQEAFAVADEIAVMDRGRLEVRDAARRLRANPRTQKTARFLGLDNIYEVLEVSAGRVRTAWGDVPAPAGYQSERYIVVRPESVRLTPGPGAKVRSVVYRGESSEIELDVGYGQAIRTVNDVPLEVGSEWDIAIDDGGTAWIR